MTRREEKREAKGRRKAFVHQFYRNNAGLMILCMLLVIADSLLELSISFVMQQLLDVAIGTELAPLIRTAWLVAGLAAAFALICAIRCAVFPAYMRRALCQYKDYAFEKITKKSISSFSGENTSRYISALTNDITSIETNYLSKQFNLVGDLLSCAGALMLMFYYSPTLTGWTIGLSLLPLVASILTGGRLAVREKEVSHQNESFVDTVKDMLTGFTVVKSFKAEKQAVEIFLRRNQELEDCKKRRRVTELLITSLAGFAGVISQFGVFLVGVYLAVTGQGVTPGVVIAFVQLCNYILQPIGTVPAILASRKASMALVDQLAEAVEAHAGREGQQVDSRLDDAIRFDGVSFGYEEDHPVLKDVSCRFEKGRSYAIVGPSGCGKSTLLNLLMGGYDGYDGSITIDGEELRDIASDSLYDLLSIVQQNVFVFNDTIRRNMTMFREFPDSEVEEAIRQSGLSGVIASKGLEYPCGENGSGLSGGERQRLSIARCLLRKTPVMLIDEATAALDNTTAHEVTEAILNLHGLTRIVVTHRLEASLLERYDGIYVLRGGTVCEKGTFRELMARDGYFKSLFTVSQDAS